MNKAIALLKDIALMQPVVLLFSATAVLAKSASGFIPSEYSTFVDFVVKCFLEWRLWGLIIGEFVLLVIYAYFWQKILKKRQLAVVYANKSSAILWTQLSAVFLFHERLNIMQICGLFIVFSGILLVNSSPRQ